MPLFKRASSEPFDAVRFSSSWILPPIVLGVVRAAFSLYTFACIIAFLVMDGKRSSHVAGHYFSYFTSLSYFGLAFYFAFAALHSGTYALTGTPSLARWPKFLQYLHSVFYTTITVYPFLVTIVYWALIYIGFLDSTEVWRNVSEHALNAVFALFEIIFPRTKKTPWLHIIPLIVILGGYLGVAYLTLHASHFYVYAFLDETIHSKGAVAGTIIGILAGTIVVFAVINFLIKLRRWLTEEKFSMRGRFSTSEGYMPSDTERGMQTKETAMVSEDAR